MTLSVDFFLLIQIWRGGSELDIGPHFKLALVSFIKYNRHLHRKSGVINLLLVYKQTVFNARLAVNIDSH